MACRVYPSDFEFLQDTQGPNAFTREIETLKKLAAGLSDAYCVFHSVHWTRILDPKSRALGEIDFIVMNRAGELLLVEQKTGPLQPINGDLFKSYSNQQSPKSIAAQLFRNQDGLLTKYRKVHNSLLRTINVLYCPDYRVVEAKVSGLERSQIIDSGDADLICQKLMKLLPEGHPNPEIKAVERFLKNELLIQEDLVRISSAQEQFTTRIAGGLSDWVQRLSLHPYKLRVQGTAGSGKTQLAIRELKSARERNQKVLYVCFNRPLAHHMGELLDKTIKSTSLFALCEELVRAEDEELAKKRGFLTQSVEELFELAAVIEPNYDQQYDLVVVDEGQDFTQEQADFLVSWARPDGKLLWLEDPLQNIYFKPTVNLPKWATIKAPVNYRNPKPIAEFLAFLANHIVPGKGEELIAANPIEGSPIQLVDYKKGNATDLKQATESAIGGLLGRGFSLAHITVLSFKGQAKSDLLSFEHLCGFQLKKPIANGADEYTSGQLETDTLFRYKGLSNLAIVLTEVEFGELNERTARLLFVGASRSKLALCIVHSSPLKKLMPK